MAKRRLTFFEAQRVVLVFGRYDGADIGTVGDIDEGLLYLAYLAKQDWVAERYPLIHTAIATYLADPEVQSDLRRLATDRD